LDRVSMKRARELAAKYRELCARRIDPIEHRRTESQAHKGVVTFRESFETFFALKSQTLSTDKGRTNWQYSMETYVFPTIGQRPVSEATTAEILDVLSPIWFSKPEVGKRVLQRIEAVFKSAIVRGHRALASPCVGVAQELGTRYRKVVNRRALPYGR